MQFTKNDLLRAVSDGTQLGGWDTGADLVARERATVEAFISDGGQAYGFTTLFGHLDSLPGGGDATGVLLRGHLIGKPETLDSATARGIVTVKLCQLSHGGTGISPTGFGALREAFDTGLHSLEIDLAASYGSGDVVPGAWLVRSVFGDNAQLLPGDLMALINGSYFGAGVILGNYQRIAETVTEAVHLVEEASRKAHDERLDPNVQLPVSLRDVGPLQEAVSDGMASLDTALLHAANRRSGNPLFEFSGSTAKPVSNASFLDFRLTYALQTGLEMVRILGSYITAATRWIAMLAERYAAEHQKPLFVQLPKVCKAYQDGMSSLAAAPAYAQLESQAVEDISDSTLLSARHLLTALELAERQSTLLRSALEVDHVDDHRC